MVVGVVLVLGLALALAQDYEEDGSGDGDDRKASVKGKCKNSGPKPKDRIFAKYTKPYPANKCPCWCAKTGFQCLPDRWNGPDSRDGSRCQSQNNQKYCKSVQGDCRHIQGACPPEQCVYQEKLNKYLKYH